MRRDSSARRLVAGFAIVWIMEALNHRYALSNGSVGDLVEVSLLKVGVDRDILFGVSLPNLLWIEANAVDRHWVADPIGPGRTQIVITFLVHLIDQLRAGAKELVERRVSVIAPMGIDAAQAAKQATSSIPIVFVFGVDPIKFGFVRSLSKPGGNITGMSLYTSELHAKRVELLDELVAASAPIGMIVNPKMPDTDPQVQSAEAAAGAKGHPLVVVKASSEDELYAAFAALAEHRVAGVLAVSDAFLNSRRDQIIALAARYSVPMMYPFRADAAAGGLLSYGTNIDEVYRQAGIYVGRILKGERPGELPIQQPTKFTLALNLKTARALGITFSPTLLVRADEVIE
jgi:putative tryptophan/tyrosine transport system substrate-binding protein